jgi:hypothetical protein
LIFQRFTRWWLHSISNWTLHGPRTALPRWILRWTRSDRGVLHWAFFNDPIISNDRFRSPGSGPPEFWVLGWLILVAHWKTDSLDQSISLSLYWSYSFWVKPSQLLKLSPTLFLFEKQEAELLIASSSCSLAAFSADARHYKSRSSLFFDRQPATSPQFQWHQPPGIIFPVRRQGQEIPTNLKVTFRQKKW